MKSDRFAYIWQYLIDPVYRGEFLAAYDSQGEWARLFSRDPSYIETMLLQDPEEENRYVTIDFWKSKADRDMFQKKYTIEFDRLDSRCESFTTKEQFLGDYLGVDYHCD